MNYNHRKNEHRDPPTTKKEARQQRRDDFIETYQWQLQDYGESLIDIKVELPSYNYHKAHLYCAENKLCVSEWLRYSIRKNISSIPSIFKIIDKNKIATRHIKTALPLKEYYPIGLKCIDSGVSISEFVRQSITKHIDKFDLVFKKKKTHKKTIGGDGKVVMVNVNNREFCFD